MQNVIKHDDNMGTSENVLSVYLKEISRIPLLTRQQEIEYAKAARDGNQKAIDMLVKSNLRFVVNVAKKYQNQGLPLLDLISEGNIGLISAIKHFDIDKGFHFISYAVWWIRQAILKAICEKGRMIRLPLNRANELIQIEKAKRMIESSMTEVEEVNEVARMLEMQPNHVANLIDVSREMVSLEAPAYKDNDAALLGDFMESEMYDVPEDMVLEQGLKDDINQVLGTLSNKEREVIEYRFGLNGKRAMSLKEIGDSYKLTKERIRQIEKSALRRLAHPNRACLLESYVA